MNLPLERGRCPSELAFAYGHESKKVRLRAIGEEKESYYKYLNKRVATRISVAQLVLAAVMGVAQIVTIGLVVGQYSHDATADLGAGIWTSMIVLISAIETLWCLKNAKYWKLHLAFALHIVSMLILIILACCLLGSTIPNLKYKLGRVMFPDDVDHNSYHYDDPKRYSAGLLATSLLLNSVMAVATLIQLIGSFFMTLMTGRSICCGSNKATGKLFELEIAGSSSKDGGVLVMKRAGDLTAKIETSHQRSFEEPPPYTNSIAQKTDVLPNV